MRLILLDRLTDKRFHFDPLALSRPIWELRVGMTTLAEKMLAKTGATDVACFVPPYMAEVYRAQTGWPVNDAASLTGDDLLIVHGRVKAEPFDVAPTGPSEAAFDQDGDCLFARIAQDDLGKLNAELANYDQCQAEKLGWTATAERSWLTSVIQEALGKALDNPDYYKADELSWLWAVGLENAALDETLVGRFLDVFGHKLDQAIALGLTDEIRSIRGFAERYDHTDLWTMADEALEGESD